MTWKDGKRMNTNAGKTSNSKLTIFGGNKKGRQEW